MKHYLPNDKPIKQPNAGFSSILDFTNYPQLYSPIVSKMSQTNTIKPPFVQPSSPRANPTNASDSLGELVNKQAPFGQGYTEQTNSNDNDISPMLNDFSKQIGKFEIKMPEFEKINFKTPEFKIDAKDTMYQRSYDSLMEQKENPENKPSIVTEYQKLLKLTNSPLYDKLSKNKEFNKTLPNFSFKPRRLEKNGDDNVFEKVGDFFSQTANQMVEASETSRKLEQNMMVNYGKNAKKVVDTAKDLLTNTTPYFAYSAATHPLNSSAKLLMQVNPGFRYLTQQEASTNTKNYVYNTKAYENNLKNKTAGPGIYINGQGRDEYKDFKFGVKGTVGGNGCMGISIYNSLISLNDYESLPDINYKLSLSDGTLFGGEMGGNPTYIKPYLMSKGYEVESQYLPNQETIENSVKSGDTAILLYGYNNPPGAHYITIDYDANDAETPYTIYNEYNRSLKGEKHNNLSSFTEGSNHPIAVYLIRK